jgi:hypothetical protein
MQALAVALQEAGQEPIPERLQQLHLSATREPKLDPAPGPARVAPHQVLAPEGVAIERQGRLDRAHGDGDVVQAQLGHPPHSMGSRLRLAR